MTPMTPMTPMVKDLDITIVHLGTSEVLRELTIDLTRGYQEQTLSTMSPNLTPGPCYQSLVWQASY